MRDEYPETFEALLWDFLERLDRDEGGWRKPGETIAQARERILQERRSIKAGKA